MSLYLVEIRLKEWIPGDDRVLDIVDVEFTGDPGPFNQYVSQRAYWKFKTAHPEIDPSSYHTAFAECVDDIVEHVIYPKGE